ncbi:MAG: methyltransferase domain-containing protein, partial [Proteobacteria bacterium]|nr:methyltransferase domain-containing protein [Pseudomonadota bacterium]
ILVKQYESRLLMELLNPLPGEKILDVGCGTGVFTIDVMAEGPIITGMDISEPMLRKAVEKIKKIHTPSASSFTGACADMCALPFADNRFDKVVSMTALEFVADAKKAVAELDRVTRHGGTIVLTTLNSLSPWADKRRKAAEKGHDLFQKIIFRSPDEMRSLVPANHVVKTAIHFQTDDCLSDIPGIERQGEEQGSEKGAFLAVQWKKIKGDAGLTRCLAS